jgi:quercetin dioxygenase-like cupin family protein
MRRARAPLVIAGMVACVVGVAARHAPQPDWPTGKGTTWVTTLDNDTVKIVRHRMPPATGGIIGPMSDAHVVVQITAGEVEINQIGANSRGHRVPGDMSFVPPDVAHQMRNIGRTTFDQLVIRLKSTRAPAPAAPATAAPPGITRETVLDNDTVRVVRVRFDPDGREPVHTHPNDLLTIQITKGVVEIVNGNDTSTASREPGFVQFLPRNVTHAFASADTQPFEILSVAIK